MIRSFLTDIKNMHWAPRLILILVVLKTLMMMYRESTLLG